MSRENSYPVFFFQKANFLLRQKGRATSGSTSACNGRRGRGRSRGQGQSDRGRGRAKGLEGLERSLGGHSRLIVGFAIAIPSDVEQHFGGEELDDNFPASDRPFHAFREEEAIVRMN